MSSERSARFAGAALACLLGLPAPAAPEPFEKEFKREWETKQWGLKPYPGEENDLVFLAPEKDEKGVSTRFRKIEIRKLDGKVLAGAEMPAEVLLLRPGGPGRALVLTGPDEGQVQHLLEIDAKGETVWALKIDPGESGLSGISCADSTEEGAIVLGCRKGEKGDSQVVAELDGEGNVLRELVWKGPGLSRKRIHSVRVQEGKSVLVTAEDGVFEADWTGKILRTIHAQKRCQHAPDADRDLLYHDALQSGEGRFIVSFDYKTERKGQIRGRIVEIDVEGKEIWSVGYGTPHWIQLLPTEAILVWSDGCKAAPMKFIGSTEGVVAMEFHRRGNGGIRERVNGRNGISRWYSKEHGPFQAKGPVCRVHVQASPDRRLGDEAVRELCKQGILR